MTRSIGYIISISLSLAYVFTMCSKEDKLPFESRRIEIKLINGGIQNGSYGDTLPDQLVIKILDNNQSPLTNTQVHFRLSSDSGLIIHNGQSSKTVTVFSDSKGECRVAWLLGESGENHLAVSLFENYPDNEPLTITALPFGPDRILLLSMRWLHSEEILFPYNREPWYLDHDNRMLESEHFITFSDYSSDEVKQNFAQLAEKAFYEVLEALEISDGIELGVEGFESKVKIYTRKSNDTPPNQYTFSYGFLIYGKDSYLRSSVWPERAMIRFDNELKHEVVHMVQYLLGAHYGLCHDWFMEGIAEYLSDGAFYPITSGHELDSWIDNPLHQVNPLDIRSIEDYPEPYSQTSGEYYPMFHLVLDYLMGENGLNGTTLQIKNVLIETGRTNDFPTSFSQSYGISEDVLKEDLFQKLAEYLAQVSD